MHIIAVKKPIPTALLESKQEEPRSTLFKFVKDLAWNTAKKFQADNCPQLAASITYYVVFSTFPVLILIAGVIGLVFGESDRRTIIEEALAVIPLTETDAAATVDRAVQAISGNNALPIALVGLAGAAWGASGMFNAVRRALNIVYREPTYNRPWFQQKAIDLGFVLGVGVFFTGSIATTTTLRITGRGDDATASAALILVEYAVPFIASFIAFVILYTIVPSRNRNLGNAWPGALAAALGFEIVKFGFGYYVENFKNFDLIFGSLGAIATFMFWVYLSSQIMLFGAEVATVYPTVLPQGYKQTKFIGMGVPFQTKVYRAVRKLFLQDGPKLTDKD